ncbi:hypothetical protein Tsubulata_014835 [Turnera subulata]|uniref:DUF4283 domain-containing protein n=1 Tax=Turnera subulata TaxID=218843 RepID=A0A9Q0J6N1_9ROSI|nr:hypothetical protein Tsubulata_014835 [Turnera subulata]
MTEESHVWDLRRRAGAHVVAAQLLFLSLNLSAMASEDSDPHPVYDDYLVAYEEPAVDFGSEDEAAVPGFANSVLVGKVISEVRCFSSKVTGEAITRAWNLNKPLVVNEVRDNTFLFSIESKADLFRILSRAPWSLSGCHLCLKEWPANRVLHEIKFDDLAFWVQVPGLPPNYMRLSKADRVAMFFPQVLEFKLPVDDSCLWGEFFRVRVRINIYEPLPTGFITKGVEDVAIRINFQYEELADFCYYCGQFQVRTEGRANVLNQRAKVSTPRVARDADRVNSASTGGGMARGEAHNARGMSEPARHVPQGLAASGNHFVFTGGNMPRKEVLEALEGLVKAGFGPDQFKSFLAQGATSKAKPSRSATPRKRKAQSNMATCKKPKGIVIKEPPATPFKEQSGSANVEIADTLPVNSDMAVVAGLQPQANI